MGEGIIIINYTKFSYCVTIPLLSLILSLYPAWHTALWLGGKRTGCRRPGGRNIQIVQHLLGFSCSLGSNMRIVCN